MPVASIPDDPSPLIVALDYPALEGALGAVEALRVVTPWFKVGLELFGAAGPAAVEACASRGCSVFLDLKLHDIPATVERAVASLSAFGVRMLTVHAQGGPRMLEAALRGAARSNGQLQVLAVTVLTSFDQEELGRTGIDGSCESHALRLATMAHGVGVRGFVCSSHEVPRFRAELPNATLVVPGVRPDGSAQGDQRRVATPHDAMARGADWIVVGRPIRDASDPVAMARSIVADARSARPIQGLATSDPARRPAS